MEQIEQQINLLESQIEAVSYQIETVESYLKKPSSSWTDEEKETYGTKEQLRTKKEQLRREEVQLLEQKTILMKKEAKGVPMDVDIEQHTSIEKLELKLRSMIDLEGTERAIFTVEDSMDNILPVEDGILNIQIPSINDIPDLLYSEDIYKSEKELGIEMPVDKLVKIKNKTVVLLGVSGCGKTRSCYDLCRRQWGLYFDCCVDSDLLEMINRLKCTTGVAKTDNYTLEAFYSKLIGGRDFVVIFDESQTLFNVLKFDYRSPKFEQQNVKNDGYFEHPRSFFSFLSRIIIQLDIRSIWCGTHMRIRIMDSIVSFAGGKPNGIFVFTDFTYLTPTNIAQLLSKWLNTQLDPLFIQKASHLLQGRPRFLISFLHRLRNISDHSQLLPILDGYCSVMATLAGKEDTNSSLYSFWYQYMEFDSVPFSSTGTALARKKLISDILIKLCISWLFGNGESINFIPSLNMVSTGLVMVKNEGDNWSCIMAEPLSLTAGLNYLADQSPDALMDYFANQLFVPLGSGNLTPQERGNMMELVITLRFMMSWWKDSSVQQYLPGWLKNDYYIPKPCGVLDCRGGTNSHILFIQQLDNQSFPWIVLPPTKAGPDIRYSLFSCYVKTTWTKNSAKTMFVSAEECRKNIDSMDPTCWYSSQQDLNREVQDRLPKHLVHMRFELPYTAPLFANGEEGGFKSSFEGNNPKICIDLKSDLAVPFFGAKFVEKYQEFAKNVLQSSYVNHASLNFS